MKKLFFIIIFTFSFSLFAQDLFTSEKLLNIPWGLKQSEILDFVDWLNKNNDSVQLTFDKVDNSTSVKSWYFTGSFKLPYHNFTDIRFNFMNDELIQIQFVDYDSIATKKENLAFIQAFNLNNDLFLINYDTKITDEGPYLSIVLGDKNSEKQLGFSTCNNMVSYYFFYKKH